MHRHLLSDVLRGLFLLVLICLPACQEKKPGDKWLTLGSSVLEHGQNHDVNSMVEELSLTDLGLGEFVMKSIVEANPDLEYVPPEHPPRQEEINDAYQQDVELFIKSYEDLLTAELACVATGLKEVKGIDSYSVVVFVKNGGKLHGVMIDDVVSTPKGLKVNSWVKPEHVQPLRGSKLVKKRAIIESDTCAYPQAIKYETEWTGS